MCVVLGVADVVRIEGGGYGGGAPQDEIVATTFGVRVKRLILITGTDYQDQLDEISCQIKTLDPDAMLR